MDLAAFNVSHSTFTLSNGLRCVVFERPGMPVDVRAAFKAGSRYDAEGREGQAHFLEHMVVAGTKKFPTKTDLATFVEGFGGVFGASTTKEEINLNIAIGDPVDLEIAFGVLGQMLTQSLFDDSTIENERQAVLGERGNNEANATSRSANLQFSLLFQQTVTGRSGVGTVAGVNDVTKTDLTSFLMKLLTTDRGLIIVSGGVTSDQVEKAAERHLSTLPQGESVFDDGELPSIRATPIMIEKMENAQLQISFGFRTCVLGHADATPLRLAATILGGGRSSTLIRILRQEQGLVYSAGVQTSQMMAGGWWLVKTTAPKDKLQAVLDATCGELKRFHEGGITQAELNFAKSKTIKSTLRTMQTSLAWVDFHTCHNLHLGTNWTIADYISAIETTTLDDIHRVGAKYFAHDSWYLGLVGDVTKQDFIVNY